MGNAKSISNGVDPSNQRLQTQHEDPRSPTKEISRTPLRFGSSKQNQQQNIDPRSPSGCIDRTPIQLSQKTTGVERITLDCDSTQVPVKVSEHHKT